MNNEILKLKIKELYNSTPDDVHSVGYGYKSVNGQLTDELSVIFGVKQKKSLAELDPSQVLPSTIEIDGQVIKTDVQARSVAKFVSNCYACGDSSSASNRSLKSKLIGGISFSPVSADTPGMNLAATLGGIFVDNEDGSLVALTNNHAIFYLPDLAINNYLKTDPAVLPTALDWSTENRVLRQPGSAEGGASQNIGKIKRYIPFDVVGNGVDASIIGLENLSQISSPATWKTVDFSGAPQFLGVATTSELDNILINRSIPQIIKSGRSSGLIDVNCDVRIIETNVFITVGYADSTDPNNERALLFDFLNTMIFAYNATTIVNNPVTGQPTSFYRENVACPGDSGSLVIGKFGSTYKIIGLLFAGGSIPFPGNDPNDPSSYPVPNNYGIFCRIDYVCEFLNISPYLGGAQNLNPSTNWTYITKELDSYNPANLNSPLGLTEYFVSPLGYIYQNGYKYWQAGTDNNKSRYVTYTSSVNCYTTLPGAYGTSGSGETADIILDGVSHTISAGVNGEVIRVFLNPHDNLDIPNIDGVRLGSSSSPPADITYGLNFDTGPVTEVILAIYNIEDGATLSITTDFSPALVTLLDSDGIVASELDQSMLIRQAGFTGIPYCYARVQSADGVTPFSVIQVFSSSSDSASPNSVIGLECASQVVTPSPTPTPTISVSPTPSVSVSNSPGVTPSNTPTNTPTASTSVTPTPSVTATRTPTPTVSPSSSSNRSCATFVSPMNAIIGTTGIRSTYTGSVGFNPSNPFTFPAFCDATIVAPQSVTLGSGINGAGPFTFTLNFTAPHNNLMIVLTAIDDAESFTFTSNGGTPTITTIKSCNTSVSGNIIDGLNPGGGGGIFVISAPSNYTTLTISGPGGSNGSFFGICAEAVNCTNLVTAPTTLENGTAVSATHTGSLGYAVQSWGSCNNSIRTPIGSAHLGGGGPFSYTLNFSNPINNISFALTGTGYSGNENFIITTNGGTPTITTITSCHTTINGNEIISGFNGDPIIVAPGPDGTSGGGGGLFRVSAPSNFTSLTVSGNGGYAGSFFALCSSVPPAPTPSPTVTPTPTRTPAPTPIPCVALVNAPTTIGTLTITESFTGDVQTFTGALQTSCGSITTPQNARWLAQQNNCSYTLNFSYPINNFKFALTCVDNLVNNFGETFTIVVDNPSVIGNPLNVAPIIVSDNSCSIQIVNNTIRSTGANGGGTFIVTAPNPFTTFNISTNSVSATNNGTLFAICATIMPTPTPTASTTVSPTPTKSVTPTPTIGVSPTPTSSVTRTPTPTVSLTPSLTPSSAGCCVSDEVTVDLVCVPSPTPSTTATATPTPTITPSFTPTLSPTQSVTNSVTPSASPSQTPTNTPTNSPTNTPTNTPTPTMTPPPSELPTEGPTEAPSPSPYY